MNIYKFIKFLYLYFTHMRVINKVYKEENFVDNLSKLFKHEFKIDWVGRVYTVLNPLINMKDELIYSYESGTERVSEDLLNKWIMDKMLIADEIIKNKNLFDILTYEVKLLDKYNNYLFILQPIVLPNTIKYAKRSLIELLIILITIISIIIIF